METFKRSWGKVPKLIRQMLVAMIGIIVILAGMAMLVTPGPGWVAIFLGLAILATEFVWAHRFRDWTMHKFKSAWHTVKKKSSRK